MTLQLQHLETRENPSASLSGGDLFITGSIYNDSVVVQSLGGSWVRLTENGHSRNFNVWGGDIVFRGGFGNDFFRNNSLLRSTAYGSYGNDVLIGGGNTDLLVGGPNNDRLIGRDSTDYLYGEYGSDFLNGGNGNDYLDGGANNDVVYSGIGFDRYAPDDWVSAPDFDYYFDVVG